MLDRSFVIVSHDWYVFLIAYLIAYCVINPESSRQLGVLIRVVFS